MKRVEKLQVIEGLVEKLSTFGCFYVIDAMGLTVEQVNKFRKSCVVHNLVYQVAKNTLIQHALEQSGARDEEYATFFSKVLKGFSGILFTSEAGSAPAKMLKNFLAAEKLNLPILKGASIYGDLFIGVECLDRLSTLKSKDELVGDIMALLKTPMSNVMASLQSGEKRLMGAVETLSNAFV
ncbi:50S ribosomal protein L10 [Candidatus Cardinium hertigii]|jgi:large subunit ribosomal protein L10|uniref:50S ribosomal protein L10 n=1 Tax=Candidatus Cardinium hertigii TaxID=247481 RepID=A0A3N2QC45_9BACT|nr:50S ribosomal protein L10 [Candidatus Cardinium hertigii]ROT47321.1 50S ribosomal protein L10 [Candidatus Cardinium hertigii]